jgi:hypothetical protein
MSGKEIDDFPELMTEAQASELLKAKIGVGSQKTLRRWRCTGGGPRFVKISTRVRYRREDLIAYAHSRVSDPIENTAQAPGYVRYEKRLGRPKTTSEARTA